MYGDDAEAKQGAGKTMKNAENPKREIFVFVGQNSTCGTPHPVTGRMNTYGTIYRVNGTLKQAREWAEMKDDGYARTLIAVGGRRKMREFCMGTLVAYFEQDIECAPTVYADDDENACNWNIG